MANETEGLTPCDEGEDLDFAILHLREGQSVELRMALCNSPFRVTVIRDETVIFDERDLSDGIAVPIEGLTSGDHALAWTFLPSASPWKTRSEIFADGNLEFRKKKSGNGNNSSGRLGVLIQVAP